MFVPISGVFMGQCSTVCGWVSVRLCVEGLRILMSGPDCGCNIQIQKMDQLLSAQKEVPPFYPPSLFVFAWVSVCAYARICTCVCSRLYRLCVFSVALNSFCFSEEEVYRNDKGASGFIPYPTPCHSLFLTCACSLRFLFSYYPHIDFTHKDVQAHHMHMYKHTRHVFTNTFTH